MKPLLSKTRVVLTRITDDPTVRGGPVFSDISDEAIDRFAITVPLDIYSDMGQPKEIRVTVRPGDQLNKPKKK